MYLIQRFLRLRKGHGKDKMKVTIVSCFYNDEFIAPFFMEHYKNEVDRFIICLDKDTTDSTKEVLLKYPNVEFKPLVFTDGWDEVERNTCIEEAYKSITDGWVIMADSDELIFNEEFIPLKEIFNLAEQEDTNLIRTVFRTPFRHKDDVDLDPTVIPIVYQRRHGVRSWVPGQDNFKPNIVKHGLNVHWGVGLHTVDAGEYKVSSHVLTCAHWAAADPEIWRQRYLNRQARLSAKSINHGWGVHYRNDNVSTYMNTVNLHMNDSQVF